MGKKVIYGFAIILITLGCWFSVKLYWGVFNPGILIVLAIAVVLITFFITPTIERISDKIWVGIGLLIMFAWFLPVSIFVKLFPIQVGDPLGPSMAFTQLAGISIALIIVALTINASLRLYKIWLNKTPAEHGDPDAVPKHTVKIATAFLVFSLLLLVLALFKFYWFMIWDNTVDGLGYLWLPIPMLAVLASTFLLLIALPGKIKLAAIPFLLLIPAIIWIATKTQNIDFRQLTKERATQVDQAIGRYYDHKGSYPRNLDQLTPRYLFYVPQPLVIYGQEWCYDAGDNYYRLGYVDREHWSAPHFIGRIYQTKGDMPELYGMCEQEAAALQKRYPDFPYEYWVEGE